MPSFKKTQTDFAAHIRDPLNASAPSDVDDRRLKIYRDLFINSIAGLLEGSFPVMRTLYEEEEWKSFVRSFFKKENNKTPHFPEIPREFVEFLQRQEQDQNKPFLAELAHYEWIELYLEKHASEETKNTEIKENLSELIRYRPLISNVAEIHCYHYPVHQIKQSYQPIEKLEQALFILIWRNQEQQIRFSHLNAFSALLFEKLKSNKASSAQVVLQQLAAQHQHPDPQQFVDFGHQALIDWYNKDIIYDVNK